VGAIVLAIFWLSLPARADDEWQPVSAEDLRLTTEPKAPGAPAIYLYRQVDRDDRESREVTYERIKILTEDGRKYADIEVPFVKDRAKVVGVKARTIQPDGTIADFDGKVYEKTVVKAKSVKYLAKTFTLPNVRVGTIVDYRYTVNLNTQYVYDSGWILSGELFTKRARFSLKPNPHFTLQSSWPVGLPAGTQPPKNENGVISLETQDVPAFQVEDHIPPERELKCRVDFIYHEGMVADDPAEFCKQEAKRRYGRHESFLNKRKAMEEALAQIISPNDSQETKLQKIYARVQQVRNRSFEREKSEQEKKREKQKDINNVEDVWKEQEGWSYQINYLFIALARAAGFEAYRVDISRRDVYAVFNPRLMNPWRLNGEVILVRRDGKDYYFDPGTAFAPYGVLPWPKTAVQGLLADKDGGKWIETSLPSSSETRIERRADLNLSEDGTVEGKVTVTYSGVEALWLRMQQRDEDDTSRKKLLEDLVKETVPVGCEVELTNQPDWKSAAPTFVAEYKLKIQDWVSRAGRRAMIPMGMFSSSEKHLFEHAERVHPIYFHNPYLKVDDITINLPLGWKIESTPGPIALDGQAVGFDLKSEDVKGALHLSRTLRIDAMLVDKQYYGALRSFFQSVRSGDEQQVVLQPIS
jgi:hypothetical protein